LAKARTNTWVEATAGEDPVILEVVTRGGRGGAQVHLAEFLTQARESARFHVACGEDSCYLERVCRSLGVPYHRVQYLQREIRLDRDVLAYRELLALARDIQPDVVHGHTAKAGLLTRLVGLRLGVPSVYTPHGYSFTPRSGNTLRAISWMFELGARIAPATVVTGSQYESELAVASGVACRSRVHLIPSGVGDSEVRTCTRPTQAPVVVMVARFFEPKDHALMLTASALVKEPQRFCHGDHVCER
jgi:glycosyltransferase involved in cell wall biosynthesis